MAKVTVLILAVFICQLCFGDHCTFSGKRVIFLERFGDITIILPSEGSVPVHESKNIVAFCPENFSNKSTNEFVLNCEREQQIENLECPRNSKIYKHHVVGCTQGSYIYRAVIKGVPIDFVEVCFDLNKFRPKFLHYVVAVRTPILEYQPQYNPNWSNVSSDTEIFASRIFEVFALNRKNGFKQDESSLYAQLNYEMTSLLPAGLFSPYFADLELGVFENVLWWKPLKEGNWKLYEYALRKKARDTHLDIYAGVSHIADVSLFESCDYKEQLKFKESHKDTEIPLYVWNYVRERNGANAKEIVVVGVNSPYVSFVDLNQTIICADICDRIEWLGKLKKVRKMPSLGVIFCCDPSEVRNKLRGFPDSVSSLNSIETVETIPSQWDTPETTTRRREVDIDYESTSTTEYTEHEYQDTYRPYSYNRYQYNRYPYDSRGWK